MKKRITTIILIFLLNLIACNSDNNSATTEINSDASPSENSLAWDSLAESDWEVAWTGYGEVNFNEGMVLEPMAPTQGETHSALVLLDKGEDCLFEDFRVTLEVTNEEQLRETNPNTWEVFWLFFNTLLEGSAEQTNYFILKTNGVELGTSDDDVGQTFLYTSGTPKTVIGQKYQLVVEKTGQLLTVTIDGVEAFTFNGDASTNKLFDHAGTIALYTEDARVRIHSIITEPFDTLPETCFAE